MKNQNLMVLPATPRQVFEALSGKRPDLAFTPTRGHLTGVTFQGDNHPQGNAPGIVAVYGLPPGMVFTIGGVN